MHPYPVHLQKPKTSHYLRSLEFPYKVCIVLTRSYVVKRFIIKLNCLQTKLLVQHTQFLVSVVEKWCQIKIPKYLLGHRLV